ncbi:MAG: CoA-binding protein [Alphaproteobacteria bacterium]|nr:CoA-binding protein [Alphaproteobacteria bacterium]
MFFLPTKETPILCQGITSQSGAMHTELALAYGSNIVAGTSPDKNVKKFLGVPVFKKVKDAVASVKPQISVVFSTPAHVVHDVEEAIEAGIQMIICITENVPMHDSLKMKELAEQKGVCLLGPSSMGIGVVGQTIVGAVPVNLFAKGKIGLVGRSSSLLWEAASQLAASGLGVSACISLGADHLIGTSFIEPIKALLKDDKTQGILAIGQVHGELEYELAAFYKRQKDKKPLWFYIPGRALDRSEKRPLLGMQAVKFADIIDTKKQALEAAGAIWIDSPDLFGKIIKKGKKK